MPAKSKHMERRKQRIANAKKNARLAAKHRRRRQLQAAFGLLAIAVLLTAGMLWQTGYFESEEPPLEDTPVSELEELLPEEPADDLGEEDPPAEEEADPPAEDDEDPPEDEATNE